MNRKELTKTFTILNLPIDIQLTLFDSMVTPILLYGCEAWGNENIDGIIQYYIFLFVTIICYLFGTLYCTYGLEK